MSTSLFMSVIGLGVLGRSVRALPASDRMLRDINQDTLQAESEAPTDAFYSFLSSQGLIAEYTAVQEFVKANPLDSYDAIYDICDLATSIAKCSMKFLRENTTPGKLGWLIKTDPADNTRCNDGTAFAFTVYPGSVENENTMFLFSGGGLCYDYETCAKASIAYTGIFAPPDVLQGLHNQSEPLNPVVADDYSLIVNNYCSGDSHLGYNQTAVVNDEPYSDASYTAHFHGADNTLAVLKWLEAQNEVKPSRNLVFAGHSAGGVALQMWGSYLLEKYSPTHFLTGSSSAMIPENGGQMFADWNTCALGADLFAWNASRIELCRNGGLYDLQPIIEETVVQLDTSQRYGYVGTSNDETLAMFYMVLSSRDYSSLLPFMAAFAEANAKLPSHQIDLFKDLEALSAQVSSYIVTDNFHNTIEGVAMYNASVVADSAKESGYTMLNYIQDLLDPSKPIRSY